ncbi:MAG TPA: tryptophan synthase subunit alpha [Kofleriaceae bacterium]|nr:tryptophan synthase subunit alpha [Kofleriaceae bacterium]
MTRSSEPGTGRDRVAAAMAAAGAENRAALVAYLTFGDPTPEATVDIILAAHRAGADIIELGVPFSDPSADGPVIQRAMERALARGADLDGALACTKRVREAGCDVPIVLFGYYNPIFVRGPERFARDAAAAGIDAVLTVDLPVDELGELADFVAGEGIGVVPLVAPTTSVDRARAAAPLLPPFAYYISMTGITGAGFAGLAGGETRVAAIRDATSAPVAVGFGIKTAADAARVAAYADGVVVGSAIVAAIEDNEHAPARAVADLVATLTPALSR